MSNKLFIDELQSLIRLLTKLPTVGQKSATRMVLSMIQRPKDLMLPLLSLLQLVSEKLIPCEICHNIDVATPCRVCCDQARNLRVITVVSDLADLWSLEKSGVTKSRYHVLGGLLSALDGIIPDNLNIQSLLYRINENVEEVVLCLSTTIEGQTTAYYLLDILKEKNVKVSYLAQGLPIGSDIDYIDESTLKLAFDNRKLYDIV